MPFLPAATLGAENEGAGAVVTGVTEAVLLLLLAIVHFLQVGKFGLELCHLALQARQFGGRICTAAGTITSATTTLRRARQGLLFVSTNDRKLLCA